LGAHTGRKKITRGGWGRENPKTLCPCQESVGGVFLDEKTEGDFRPNHWKKKKNRAGETLGRLVWGLWFAHLGVWRTMEANFPEGTGGFTKKNGGKKDARETQT